MRPLLVDIDRGSSILAPMSMTPGLRKLALTAHVTSTVGWLGAVASFLALAVAGLAGRDEATVRAAYLAMQLTGWYVIVPLCFASLATGLVQALGTPWGFVRHYWIIVKLLIAVVSTILLLVHMQPTGRLAGAPVELLAGADLMRLRIQLAADAGAALLALLVATALAIYKPRGMTGYGARKEGRPTAAAPRWAKLLIATIVLFLIAMRLVTHSGLHTPG
jgi:hypothetical protein